LAYTESEKARFQQLYAWRRRNQLILGAALLVALVAALLTENRRSGTIVMLLGLAILAGGTLFSYRTWRCPACDQHLGRNIDPRHCPNCGVELRP